MDRTRMLMLALTTLASGLPWAHQLPAQTQETVIGTARTSIRASLVTTVPVLLDLQTLAGSTIIEQTDEYTILETRVVAASNAEWRLDVIGEFGNFDVRSDLGDYHPVGLAGTPVPIVLLRAATDRTQIVIRFRVRSTRSAAGQVRARLVLRPVRATQGAVMVTWMGSE